MAIIEYTSDKGTQLWKIYVNLRSKVDPSIRVQKWKFNCKTLKQAEREETALIRQIQAEILKQETKGSTWGAVVEAWESHQATYRGKELQAITRGDYVMILKIHTNHWWGRHAADISRADVHELINQLSAQDLSISYQHKIKTIINRVFGFAIDSRLVRGLDRSPAYGVQLRRDEEKIPEILNVSEIRTLLTEAKRHAHPWYPVWALALMTGMRNGELFALTWDDIDWENREVTVAKSFRYRDRAIKSTKAGYWRTVPMSSELQGFLRSLKEQAGDRPEVLPRLPRWENNEQARILREFCLGTGLPSIKFHTLRACFATQLIRNGIPPIQIQKICGWKDLKTMQRYIRIAGIEVEGATEGLKVLPDRQIVDFVSALVMKEAKETAA